MTDPNKSEAPTLEDELFEVLGAHEPEAAGGRSLPSWAVFGRDLRPFLTWLASPNWADIARGTLGFAGFILFDGVVMYPPLHMDHPPSTLPQAIVLLLVALGLGGALVWMVGGRWRPVGIGLIGGWLFLTLLSAGMFTGLWQGL